MQEGIGCVGVRGWQRVDRGLLAGDALSGREGEGGEAKSVGQEGIGWFGARIERKGWMGRGDLEKGLDASQQHGLRKKDGTSSVSQHRQG